MQADNAKLAEDIFVAKVAYRELSHDPGQERPEPAVLYNDLIRLVTNTAANSAALMAKINASLVLRKQYNTLVKRHSFAYSPAYAATSTSEELPTRHHELFSLAFKRDRVETGQIFALLTIHHATDNQQTHCVIVNVLSEDHCERIEFPPLIDGVTQCLFEQHDKQLQLLLDADAQISIMP